MEHAREVTTVGDLSRVFEPDRPLGFSKSTCFVLTEHGTAAARGMAAVARAVEHHGGEAANGTRHHAAKTPLPYWDRDRQELRLGDVVVKQFKVPAVNQERILAAFQEEGWPVHIDDPLPPQPEQDSKRRLHDTINSLNRSQRNPLIRFFGDGSGQGVRWKVVAGEA